MTPFRSALPLLFGIALVASAYACSDSAGNKTTPTPEAGAGEAGAEGGGITGGIELQVPVPASGRVFVKLATPAVVTPTDPINDKGWDIAFEGLDVFTNSGPSGNGGASAFGPLEPVVFIDDVAPAVPFLSPDATGGAFVRWWFYGGGAANHALFSRYHVYAVKDGEKTWKVQVLNYYGVSAGAPTAALYKLRWAEVTASGVGPVQEIDGLDGRAGGTNGAKDAPVECLDLGTGTRTMLAPSAARQSSAWHLCFRRENISVNGEVGGPRNVGAVDLDSAKSPAETLSDTINKDDANQKPAFDAVNAASLAGQPFRGDRVVSAFGTLWLERGAAPPKPANSAWLVVGADGKNYLLGFVRFDGATATSPGTIVMRVKAVQ